MFCKIVAPSSDIHKIPEVPKTYQDLQNLVLRKFKHEIPHKFFLKYKDSEEELVTLCNDEDLNTAVLTSQSDNIKTLRVFIIPDTSPPKKTEEKSEPFIQKGYLFGNIKPQTMNNLADSAVKDLNDFVGGLDYISSDPGKIYDENLELRKIYDQLPIAMDLKRSMSHNPQTELERNIGMYENMGYMDPREMFEKIPPRLTSPSIPEEISVQDYFNDGQIKAVIKLIEQKVKERIEEKIQIFSNEILARFQEEARNIGLARSTNGNMRNMGLPFGSRMAMRRGNNLQQDESQIQECTQCNMQINSVRYSCLTCRNFVCCEKCENTINHEHPLLKIRFAKGNLQDDSLPMPLDLNRSSSRPGMFQRMNSSVEVGELANTSDPLRSDEIARLNSSIKRKTVVPSYDNNFGMNSIPMATSVYQKGSGKTIYNFGYQSEVKGRPIYKAATSTHLPNTYISPHAQTQTNSKQTGEREFKQYKVALVKPPLYEVTTVKAGHFYHISFTIKNNGDTQWPENTKLMCVEGNHKNEEIALPPLNPGTSYTVDLHLEAPWELGRFFNEWKVHYFKDGNLKTFGKEISIEIEVVESDKIEKDRAKREKEKEKIEKAERGENERVGQREHSGSFHLLDKHNSAEEDKKLMKEFDCSEQVLKHAKVIQDLMCSGTLKEKIEFMKACSKDWDLNQIVSAYLTWINNPNKLKNMHAKEPTPQ